MTRAEKIAQNKASAARMLAARAAALAVVATGKCPNCRAKLRRNSSIAGWWQCSQLGAVGFRADPALPSCDWQGFTE
jgi:hypothetical protein